MQKRISKVFGVLLVSALLLCTMLMVMPAAKGQPPWPAFWVEPAAKNFDTANATVGTLFNVTVWGAVAKDTVAWQVQLGFDSSELQAVVAEDTTGAPNDFFAGYSNIVLSYPYIDNDAGTVFAAGSFLGTDHVGPTSGSLFCVTFQITAAPAQGQSLSSLIDPGYGVASYNTLFVDTNYGMETPLSTVPCSYFYCDSAVWSPNPIFVYCSPNPVRANRSVTCMAVVSGLDPTGTITWNTSSDTGFFSPSVCLLSSGSCSTTYIDCTPGTVTITASYSGDAYNDASSGSMTLTVNPQLVLPSTFLLTVPYHHQINGYYCGPAALEEVFDYYGPDIPQAEIAAAARTTPEGTYTFDMVRAAHFSNLSTSAGKVSSVSINGYTARKLGYAALEYGGMTVEELKSVIVAGYPVIVLTTWHFRVAVGYDTTHIIFQDPYYGYMYTMTYEDFSMDWDYSGHWALLVSPWHVEISSLNNVLVGDEFDVTATVTYPWTEPFYPYWPQATAINATIALPPGLSLASGESTQKTLEIPSLAPGQSFTVTWSVESQAVGNYRMDVEAEGLVQGFVPPLYPRYPEYTYEDRIGGINQCAMAVTSSLDRSSPVTTEDYDGSWRNKAFVINLTASDDMTAILETYYRINDGSEKVVSLNGQPLITTPGTNNTLQYWSVDWAGNEELPHKLLTGIKMDSTNPFVNFPERTPTAEVQPGQKVKITDNATDTLSGLQNLTLSYTLDSGTTWTVQPMTLNVSTSLYEATIPGQLAGTRVKFKIVAFDQAGNTAVWAPPFGDNTYQVPPLCATVASEDETVNLGLKGQWLEFCMEMPEGYSASDIDITTLTLNDTIIANPDLKSVGDHDQNGIQDLSVCFNRTSVTQSVLSKGVMTGNVTLAFSGRLSDGSLFEGSCTLGVRMPGDLNSDSRVDVKDVSCVAKAFGSSSGEPQYKAVLDENEDNRIDIKDIALVAKNFGKIYS
jgi:hypothetical protein